MFVLRNISQNNQLRIISFQKLLIVMFPKKIICFKYVQYAHIVEPNDGFQIHSRQSKRGITLNVSLSDKFTTVFYLSN